MSEILYPGPRRSSPNPDDIAKRREENVWLAGGIKMRHVHLNYPIGERQRHEHFIVQNNAVIAEAKWSLRHTYDFAILPAVISVATIEVAPQMQRRGIATYLLRVLMTQAHNVASRHSNTKYSGPDHDATLTIDFNYATQAGCAFITHFGEPGAPIIFSRSSSSQHVERSYERRSALPRPVEQALAHLPLDQARSGECKPA